MSGGLPSGAGTDKGALRELVPGYQVLCTRFAAVVPLYIPVLTGPEGVVLIDSGISDTPRQAIGPALKGIGRGLEQIRAVALTHGHHDHFGGLAQIKEFAPDAQVAAHHADARWVEDFGRYWRELFERHLPEIDPGPGERSVVLEQAGHPVAVDRPLAPGDLLDTWGCPPLYVINAHGAHSAGSVGYFQPDHGVLATGDSLQLSGTSLVDGSEAFPIYEDIDAYRAMLAEFEAVGFRWLVDAHRGVLDEERGRELLRHCREFPERFSEQLADLFADDDAPRTLREAAEETGARHYPRANRTAQLYITTELHLRRLVRDGVLVARIEHGTKTWRAAA
ncbi:MBL fold metallo-hydrolase [Streptomyces sp. AgN23]|uniref:MBL fold metallo-hydrolase n=1 Tax=Streptomyces sp. AgN23 TaxID=1188315 RepID=UPI001B330868|nr:MBL fold metallo-hydrolase [Streptomyces sp. AgN23]QTI87278.1 MBL fold metallo-hydrolase [Streptomyces sp. AgN23]